MSQQALPYWKSDGKEGATLTDLELLASKHRDTLEQVGDYEACMESKYGKGLAHDPTTARLQVQQLKERVALEKLRPKGYKKQ